MSNQLLEKLRAELRANADAKTIDSYQHFFKEPVKFYGVSYGTVGKIANNYWKDIKCLPKQAIFDLSEDLFRSDYSEEAAVVACWVPKLTNQFEPADLALFKHWIDSYLNDWAKVDGFCNHTVGNFVAKYPESINEIISWTASPNRWMKRAAAVSLIIPAKNGQFFPEIIQIADRLLLDKDDMVQKGYGWMLKEAGKSHLDEVYQYILQHRKDMPRTALRYAIEKMPPEMKTEAMKRII
jgi:3-methyladenine DNA glycosylase AlkD